MRGLSREPQQHTRLGTGTGPGGDAGSGTDAGPGGGARKEFVAGRVVAVMRQRAVVEVIAGGRRRLWELGQADVDFARLIPDMRRWYVPGDRLSGATVTDATGRGRYTLLAGHPNPWPALVARFPVGTTFTGPIVGVCHGIGAFVRVAGGINGRIPFAEARRAGLARGMLVQVDVVGVDAELRRVGLRLSQATGGRASGEARRPRWPRAPSRSATRTPSPVPPR